MKGQAETTEILAIVGMIVVLIAVIPIIIPTIKKSIEMFTIDSPEVISKDLASLISTSVAATDDITIKYSVPSGRLYDVNIAGKMVTVSMELRDETRKSSDPILIDAKGSFPNTKDFVIKKEVGDTYVEYSINNKVVLLQGYKPVTPSEPGEEPKPPVIPSPEMCPDSFFALTPIDCGSGKIDLLEYYIPDFPITNEIVHFDGSSNTEYFHTYLSSSDADSGIFYTTKSRDSTYFEEFKFDRDYIYHMKDTTWATEANQNVKCDNGDDAYFTLINGLYGEDNCNVFREEIEGGVLHPRCMSVGETTPTYELTVVGFSKKSCQCCKTPYVGDLPESITFVSRGRVEFDTGWSSDDVVELYKSRTRETYYYDKQLGWVGFEGPDFKTYIKNTLSEANCATLQCSIA